MKNKKFNRKTIGLKVTIFTLSLFLSFLFIFATDVNVDGGSGGYNQGNKDNFWNDHQGVRVSIYDKTGKKIGTTFDYSNNKPTLDRYYSQTSKLEYFKGAALTLFRGDYEAKKPKESLPLVINTSLSGGGDAQRIKKLKNYFRDYKVVKNVFDDAGVDYLYSWNDKEPETQEKIDKFHASIKDYKIVFEPIAYFKHDGKWWGMTATEAGLYPDQAGLKQYLKRLTHQNLPLAIYLENDDLTVTAWKGARSGIQSTLDVIKYLGIGIISFDDSPPPPKSEIQTIDYTYHTDTVVITSFLFKSKDAIYGGDEPTADFTITFPDHTGIGTRTVDNVVVPKNSSQLIWFLWKTPSTPQDIVINITGSGDTDGNITVRIVEDKEITPPDPKPHDRYNNFSNDFKNANTAHLKANNKTSTWYVYDCKWVEPVYKDGPNDEIDPKTGQSTGKKEQILVSDGYYKFFQKRYSVKLEADPELTPSELTPTASGKNMKSGYGLNSNVKIRLVNNSSYAEDHEDYTNGLLDSVLPQKIKAWFPEFLYNSYNRILEGDPSDEDVYVFKKNKFSQEFHIANNEKSRIHFTPIWFPDGEYKVKYEVYDAFTPAGELRGIVEDKVDIHGNMYQDWHMGPTLEIRN